MRRLVLFVIALLSTSVCAQDISGTPVTKGTLTPGALQVQAVTPAPTPAPTTIMEDLIRATFDPKIDTLDIKNLSCEGKAYFTFSFIDVSTIPPQKKISCEILDCAQLNTKKYATTVQRPMYDIGKYQACQVDKAITNKALCLSPPYWVLIGYAPAGNTCEGPLIRGQGAYEYYKTTAAGKTGASICALTSVAGGLPTVGPTSIYDYKKLFATPAAISAADNARCFPVPPAPPVTTATRVAATWSADVFSSGEKGQWPGHAVGNQSATGDSPVRTVIKFDTSTLPTNFTVARLTLSISYRQNVPVQSWSIGPYLGDPQVDDGNVMFNKSVVATKYATTTALRDVGSKTITLSPQAVADLKAKKVFAFAIKADDEAVVNSFTTVVNGSGVLDVLP